MVKIASVPDFDSAASAIATAVITLLPNPSIVRIEGFCGAGKTNVGGRLAALIDGIHIAADNFANKYDDPPPYPECIRQLELAQAIATAMQSGRFTILDAVCLEDVAPVGTWGRGLVVYVKQLSFNNAEHPIWHGGFQLEGDSPAEEPHRSVHAYHLRVRPHEKADLIVEVPEEGHSLPSGSFSREMCFDPLA
jgi:hypothetical protein